MEKSGLVVRDDPPATRVLVAIYLSSAVSGLEADAAFQLLLEITADFEISDVSDCA